MLMPLWKQVYVYWTVPWVVWVVVLSPRVQLAMFLLKIWFIYVNEVVFQPTLISRS